MPRTLTLSEAAIAGSATPVADRPGRFLIQLINPGWGSSGFYSTETLKEAATSKVFPAGTHMYIDHPTESEEYERPERSLRDLAAVLSEDARWDDALQALVGEATVFGSYRGVLGEMKTNIGVSIRASAEITENGTAPDGARGRIIDRLVEAISTDFVTKAGRGGKILEVLESARVAEARNVGQFFESRIHQNFTNLADSMAAEGRLTRAERINLSAAIGDALSAFNDRIAADVPHLYQRDPFVEVPNEPIAPRASEATAREATANDTRERLDQALRDAYGGEKQWVGVRDFDATNVWFYLSTPDTEGIYQIGYELSDDGDVVLSGSPIEVRATTTYVPVNPAGQNNTQESKEDTMPQIEESELARLREADGRVRTLESERDTAVERAEAAEAQRDQLTATAAETARTNRVAELVGEAATAANVELNEFESAGIAGRAVNTADGALNEAASRTAFDTAIATLVESQAGAGGVRGLGGKIPAPVGEAKASEADLDAIDDAIYGAPVKEV